MKRAIAVAAVLILFLCAGTGAVAAAEEYVEISSATELQDVRDDLDADYVLVDDIDLSGVDNFEPIGDDEAPFSGTFDGNAHTISNLTIDRSDESDVGLFGYVSQEGKVENITLVDAEVSGEQRVGTLIGQNHGDVRGSRADGNVTGDLRVGGLVGDSGGNVVDSNSDAEITSEGVAGGLVGNNYGEITRSGATGDVTGEKGHVGGLVGRNNGEGRIDGSYATGDVEGHLMGSSIHANGVGGLAGTNGGEVHGSYATGEVRGESDVGGLLGFTFGSNVRDSHAEGDVEGIRRVGGLVGWVESGTVAESHAMGDVAGRWTVGGLAGLNEDTVTQSHAEGDANGYAEVGGLIGENSGEVGDSRASGNVTADSRFGGLVGEFSLGSLINSRWEAEDADVVPAVGIRKPGTTFENVTPDTVGESGEDAGRPPASEPGGELWTFEVGDSVSTPTVVDRTVYVGSEDGSIYAISTEEGTQEWRTEIGEFVAPLSGPPVPITSSTVAGEVVYTAQQTPTEEGFVGSVHALDATSGEEVWKYGTRHLTRITSSPTVAGGTVYIGGVSSSGGSNFLYALDASTGEEEWMYETEDDISSSPTVVNDIVYINEGSSTVHAISAPTGEEEWTLTLENRTPTISSPTVSDGMVYVGFESGVQSIDASDGTEEWFFETDDTVPSSPTVADGTVYVGSWDRNVYAVDASTGEQEWTYRARDEIASSPTVADGSVYVGGGKYLHVLNAETGEERWRFEDSAEGLHTSPTVVDGTVYIGSYARGKLYAVNAGVSGSSEGSRVLLGTLGHHHTWAEEQAEYIDIDKGTQLPTLVGFLVVIAALVAVAVRLHSDEEGET